MSEFRNPSDHDPFLESHVERRTLFRVALLGGAATFLAGCEDGQPRPDVEKTPNRFADKPSIEWDFSRYPDGPIDPAIWNIKLGPEEYDGAGQQIYTDKPDNIAIRNGRFVITAHKQEMSGKPFTSGRADTLGKQSFGYGRLVVRAQMPEGRGPHPAIWMRRVPKPGEQAGTESEVYGEIDIVEHVGVNGDRAYTNLHTNETRKREDRKGIVTQQDLDGEQVPGMTGRMVEYAVERTGNGIAFFVDGKQAGPLHAPRGGSDDTWPFGEDDEYYLIFNVAIGDRWGGKEGVDTSKAPWQMEVESVKFYPENK
jgi:beta-glucanase (GH16 family)